MKVLLLDGYNLIYRARYSNMNKGEYSTIFNFFRSVRPLIEKFDPDLCYFVLEGRPKKRLEVSSDYKGQRVYHDKDNFNAQRKEIIRIVRNYFPFKIARHEDYECDDVIGYLASDVHEEDDTTIISSDTDFIQSINEKVSVYSPVKKEFLEKTDYDYVKWKALVGDKSDNIEGFSRVGDKTAQKLLSNKEDFERFLLKENNQKKFDQNVFMIKFHDLTLDKNNIQYTLPNNIVWKELKEVFVNYSFNSIIGKEKTWTKYINTFSKLERHMK
jgi:DNA polymerase I